MSSPGALRRRPAGAGRSAVLAVAALTALLVLLPIGPASAATPLPGLHQTTPAYGLSVPTAPREVRMEFHAALAQGVPAEVLVTTSAGVRVSEGNPTVAGGTVVQVLRPNLAPGTYSVNYTVVTVDGAPLTARWLFGVGGSGPVVEAGAHPGGHDNAAAAPAFMSGAPATTPLVPALLVGSVLLAGLMSALISRRFGRVTRQI